MANGTPDIIQLNVFRQSMIRGELKQTVDYVNENSSLLPEIGALFNSNEAMSDGLTTVMKEHPKAYGDMFKQIFENPEISQNLNTALIDATTEISDLDIGEQEGAYTKLFQSFIETPEGEPLSQEQMKVKLTDFTASSNNYIAEVATEEYSVIEKSGMEDIAEAFQGIKDSVVNNEDLPMVYRESFHNVFNNMEDAGVLFMNEEFLESLKEFAMDNAKSFMGRMSVALQSGGGPTAKLLAKVTPDMQIANVTNNGNVATISAAELAGIDPTIENKALKPNNDYQAPNVASLEPTLDTGGMT